MGGPLEEVAEGDNADPRFRELFTTWRAARPARAGRRRHPLGPPDPRFDRNFTSGYGVRSDPFRGRAAMHAGIDLAGPIGTPIYATADGIVGRSEWNSGGYGNLVEINHGQGIQTRYGHLSRCIARAGQRVRRGELIGLMGSTGRSTGSHLHYEVRIDGQRGQPGPLHAPRRRRSTACAAAAQSAPSPRSAARPAARRPPPAADFHKLGRGLARAEGLAGDGGAFSHGAGANASARPCAQSSPVSIWKVEWPMPKRWAMPCAQSAGRRRRGSRPA